MTINPETYTTSIILLPEKTDEQYKKNLALKELCINYALQSLTEEIIQLEQQCKIHVELFTGKLLERNENIYTVSVRISEWR